MSGINTASLKEGGVKFPKSPPHGTAYIWFRLEMNSWLDSLMNPQDGPIKEKSWSGRSVYTLGFQQIFQTGSYYFSKVAKLKHLFWKRRLPTLKKKKSPRGLLGCDSDLDDEDKELSLHRSIFCWCCSGPRAVCTWAMGVSLGTGEGEGERKSNQSVLRQSWKQLSSTHINFLPQTVLTEQSLLVSTRYSLRVLITL